MRATGIRSAKAGRDARWCGGVSRRRGPQRPLRMACRALDSPENLPSPVAEADRALQSLLESGIRGSLALFLAMPLHVSLLDAWHPDAAAAAVGLQAVAPLLALDAALLLPGGAALAAAAQRAAGTPRGRFLSLAGAALAAVQASASRNTLAGAAPGPQRAALAAVAQLSEELLSRGVTFGFAALWLHSRLVEAGMAGATLGPGGPAVEDAAMWGVAAALAILTGARYNHHAAEQVAALQRQRSSGDGAAAAAARRAAVLRYEPPRGPDSAPPAPPPGAAAAGRLDERRAQVAALALGSRAVLGSGAAYAAYLAAGGNLAASFTAGLALQLGAGALVSLADARRRRREERP